MFRKEEEEKERTRGHAVEETPNPTLDNIEITLKGGVDTKLFLNRLHLRGKYRWQTGSFIDRAKASASGGNPKSRLCSPDGDTPLAALRAWISAYGHKLEEESRKHVAGRIWIWLNGHHQRLLKGKKVALRAERGRITGGERLGPEPPRTHRIPREVATPHLMTRTGRQRKPHSRYRHRRKGIPPPSPISSGKTATPKKKEGGGDTP